MSQGSLARALDAYLAYLTVERGLAGNTLAAYRRDLARYVAFLDARGRTRPADIRSEDVEEFVLAVRTGGDGRAPLAASSAARSVVAVRGWHRFWLGEGLVAVDVSRDVRPPAAPQRLPKALTIDEVRRLLEATGSDKGPGAAASLRDRALLELLYSTGARISEAVGLDIDDLDLDPSTAAVRLLGKGSKERVVPVGSYAAEAIGAYLVRARPVLAAARRGTPALFLGARGGRLSRQSGWAVLRAAAERARLDRATHVSPHTLRHSFATHLLAGGADIRVVQELLGHASVTTTQVYTKVTPESLREVYTLSHPRAR